MRLHYSLHSVKSGLQLSGILLTALFLLSKSTLAQQPFYTDDADVTKKGKFHLQFSNEYDLLQRSSYPAKTQNLSVFELDYGLFKGVEIGVDAPLLAIHKARIARPR